MHFDDVFDQAAVFIVLVDQHLNVGFAVSDQSHCIGSNLGVGGAASRRGDVDGVTLLAFERHLLDEVRQNEVLLVGGNDFITPDFWNEFICGGNGYRIGGGKSSVCHVKTPKK